jgi:AGCS family alanine or glycine:cation symporter
MVFWGSSASLIQVWSMADVALGLMALVKVNDAEMEFKQADIKFQGKVEPGIWHK